MLQANISQLQHFSTSDGPGIRTTVFFKGCNLHCTWCHNPETIACKPSLLYYQTRCAGCGTCVQACNQNVHQMLVSTVCEANHVHTVDRSNCIGCGNCMQNCPADALEVRGKPASLAHVLHSILQDSDFYALSGGGVTLSGGEPLLQPEFCTALAQQCQQIGIPVIVDTAANVDYAAIKPLLPFVEQFYVDLKAATEQDYRAKTGGSLSLTVENLSRMVKDGADVVARIPIIPGFNDTPAYCGQLCQIVEQAGVQKVHLLPFHRLGSAKYSALGLCYPYQQLAPPTQEHMQHLLSAFGSIAFTTVES